MNFLGKDGYRLHRFTTYNVAAVIGVIILKVLRFPLPNLLLNIVRSTSLLIAVATLVFLLALPTSTFVKYYREVFDWMPNDDTQAYVVFHLHNFILHILPVLVLGLPSGMYVTEGMLIAYILLLSWYTLVRSKIKKLYIDTVDIKGYDIVVYGVLPITLFVVGYALNIVRS